MLEIAAFSALTAQSHVLQFSGEKRLGITVVVNREKLQD
jgi:hypothetical protein